MAASHVRAQRPADGRTTAGAPPRPPARGPGRLSRAGVVTLLVLLAVDGALVVADMGHRFARLQGRFTAFADGRWDSQYDGSAAEIAGYVQVALTVLVLLVLVRRLRDPVLAAWAVLLSVVVVDDAAALHERLGFALAGAVDLPAVAGLRAGDLGELLVWAGYGGVLGLVVLVFHLRSDGPARATSLQLAGALVLLMAAGAGVDMLHQLLEGSVPDRVGYALGLLESTGELVGMSLLLVVAVHRWATTRPHTGERVRRGGPQQVVTAAPRP
ncbi:hypothetical protein WDZ16_03870 [Pseudokineococcus marinus]|uniref:Uncharacterized protein n=1 Tax=Pseudokineococcus marinus TaxID=351215 RepID=A0A849BQT6_9ACTN|nr:hypothetical protein [Pseudokineococcus marinus]NNH23182.1 hypothetical protein [Pseudokineococcus marinus]